MRFKTVGTKRDIMAVTLKNADTLTIFQGAPVSVAANGTNDGLAGKTYVNLAAAVQGLFFGVALTDIAANAFGEAQMFGFNDVTRVRLTTRAASTDVWASYAAGAVGDILIPVTGTGAVAASVSADQAFSNSGSNPFTVHARVRLGQTYASATTQASSLGGSSTASVSTYKAMIYSI